MREETAMDDFDGNMAGEIEIGDIVEILPGWTELPGKLWLVFCRHWASDTLEEAEDWKSRGGDQVMMLLELDEFGSARAFFDGGKVVEMERRRLRLVRKGGRGEAAAAGRANSEWWGHKAKEARGKGL
jgi:hypothetical protein